MTLGPVQVLVVSFDEPRFTGKIAAELTRLRESDVVRLIDALAVRKNMDGSLDALRWSDLSVPEAEDLGATVGALLGLGRAGEEGMAAGAAMGRQAGADGHLIDDDELWDIADSIEPGNAAAIRADRTHLGGAAAPCHRRRRRLPSLRRVDTSPRPGRDRPRGRRARRGVRP